MSHAETLPTLRRMTIEQWAELPEDEHGELVGGFLVEEELPDYVHELVVAWLLKVLGAWADTSGAFVAGSGVKFAVSPTLGRMPDLSVFLSQDAPPPRRGVVRRPPSIAVEVLSPTPRDGRRDRVEKVAEYARFGIHWYWLVDPQARSIEILEREPSGRYAIVAGLTDGVVAVPGCDGLQIDLSALWSKIDKLEE